MSDTPTIQQWADTPVDAAIAAGPQADSDTQAPAMPALAGSPAPDLSSPPVLPNPQSPGSPDEQQTDEALSGPQAPAGGSGSMWEKILMGALSGLAGQRQHGRSSVVNGIIGGAQGEQVAQQQQQENDRANTELQSNIKFRNLQSALALATSHRQDQELEMSTQEHNDAHDANSRATIDWLQSHGVDGDIIPNTHESATNALQNANASSPEGVNVPIGIIHGSNFIFIPKNDTQDVDDEHKQVSDLSSAMGMPAPSRSQFGSMSQDQRDSMRNGLLQMSRGYDRTGGLIPAAQLPQQITLAKSALTAYQTNPNADSQTVKLMQTRIANMQQQSDDIDAHLANQEKQKELAKQNTPQGQATLAKTTQENQQNAASMGATSGTTTGPAYLKTLPPQRAGMVQAIGEGRIELTPSMLRSKDGQLLAQQATNAYPDFDQSKAQSYFKTRQDFTSGKTSVGINSYNTAIAHLGTMYTHVGGTNSLQLNNPVSDVHRQLDVDKQLVSTELTKAVSNGQMTEGEKNQILSSISGVTVGSYQTRIKEAVTLLNGKLEAYQQQWNNGAPPGAVSQVRILSPQSEATIARINGTQQTQPAQQSPQRPSNVPSNAVWNQGARKWQLPQQ